MWLRSPGEAGVGEVAYVKPWCGHVDEWGAYQSCAYGIKPALWVNLSTPAFNKERLVSYDLRLVVVDEAGKPITGAEATLDGGGEGETYFSGSDGQVWFKEKLPGQYSLSLKKFGFHRFCQADLHVTTQEQNFCVSLVPDEALTDVDVSFCEGGREYCSWSALMIDEGRDRVLLLRDQPLNPYTYERVTPDFVAPYFAEYLAANLSPAERANVLNYSGDADGEASLFLLTAAEARRYLPDAKMRDNYYTWALAPDYTAGNISLPYVEKGVIHQNAGANDYPLRQLRPAMWMKLSALVPASSPRKPKEDDTRGELIVRPLASPLPPETDKPYELQTYLLPEYDYVNIYYRDEYGYYAQAPQPHNGVMHAVDSRGFHGVVDIHGESIVPFTYDDIEMFSDFCLTVVLDPAERQTLGLTDAEGVGTKFWHSGDWNYRDSNHNIRFADQLRGYRKCHYGLTRLDGRELFPCRYDEIVPIAPARLPYNMTAADGYEYEYFYKGKWFGTAASYGPQLFLCRDRLWGAAGDDGEMILPVSYSDIRIFKGLYLARRERLWGAYDHSGKLLLPHRYKRYCEICQAVVAKGLSREDLRRYEEHKYYDDAYLAAKGMAEAEIAREYRQFKGAYCFAWNEAEGEPWGYTVRKKGRWYFIAVTFADLVTD